MSDIPAALAAIVEAELLLAHAKAMLAGTTPTPVPVPDPTPVPVPTPTPTPTLPTVTAGAGWATPPVPSASATPPVAHWTVPPGIDVPQDGVVVGIVCAHPSGVDGVNVRVEYGDMVTLHTTTIRGKAYGTIRILPGARTGPITAYATVWANDGSHRDLPLLKLYALAAGEGSIDVDLPDGDISADEFAEIVDAAAKPGRRVRALGYTTRIIGAGKAPNSPVNIVACDLELGSGSGVLLSGTGASIALYGCDVTGDPATTATLTNSKNVYAYDTRFERTRFGLPQYVRYAENCVVDGVREDAIKNPICVNGLTIRNGGAGGGGAHPDICQIQEAAVTDIAENRLLAGIDADETNAGQGLFTKRITLRDSAVVDCTLNNLHPTLNPVGKSCVLQAVECAWDGVYVAHSKFTGRSIFSDNKAAKASNVVIEATQFVGPDGKVWNGNKLATVNPVPGIVYR